MNMNVARPERVGEPTTTSKCIGRSAPVGDVTSCPVRVSLVVTTMGRTSELAILLHSLRAQRFADFEAIVVDQTRSHDVPTTHYLESMHASGEIRWYRHPDVNFALRRCT